MDETSGAISWVLGSSYSEETPLGASPIISVKRLSELHAFVKLWSDSPKVTAKIASSPRAPVTLRPVPQILPVFANWIRPYQFLLTDYGPIYY
ncbi:hypothetical protein CRG98_022671 [Punica granatum]|uniref:Uncharacterized protein n=1 Tax=Punica granatum TaxID=22663 RepID=A0A2I0JN38_PUNGR|nr:hypothetical protein CRG98_022671 [Punica granatum]